jgi:hypothetical protein
MPQAAAKSGRGFRVPVEIRRNRLLNFTFWLPTVSSRKSTMNKKIILLLLCHFMGSVVSAAAQTQTGKIIDVFGDGKNIVIQLDSSGPIQPGDQIDLSHRTETIETPMGRYAITKVKEDILMAKAISSTMSPAKGMNVRIAGRRDESDILKNSSFGATAQPQENPALPELPQVYPSFEGFRQALRSNQPVTIEQKWVLGVKIQNAEGLTWPGQAKFLGGVYIQEVIPGTPAQKAGILPGDIIFHVDGTPTQNTLELLYLINASDGKVVLTIKRSPDIYKSIIKTVKLMKFEASRIVGEVPKLIDEPVPLR